VAGRNRGRAAEKLAALERERYGGPPVPRSPPKGGDPELRRLVGSAMTKRQRGDRLELRLIGIERELARLSAAADGGAHQLAEVLEALRRLATGKAHPVDVNARPSMAALVADYVELLVTETGGNVRLAAKILRLPPSTLATYLADGGRIAVKKPDGG
jgi:hypothetical protein